MLNLIPVSANFFDLINSLINDTNLTISLACAVAGVIAFLSITFGGGFKLSKLCVGFIVGGLIMAAPILLNVFKGSFEETINDAGNSVALNIYDENLKSDNGVFYE